MPFHLFTLDALFDTYPDALIVFTHRDPKDTMGSWSSLVKHVRGGLMSDVDASQVGAEELDAMASMVHSAIDFRNSHPELKDRFFDVQYREFLADPVATVEKIYSHFNLDMTPKACEAMNEYTENQREQRRKASKGHKYNLEGAGLSAEQVGEAFEKYYKTGLLRTDYEEEPVGRGRFDTLL